MGQESKCIINIASNFKEPFDFKLAMEMSYLHKRQEKCWPKSKKGSHAYKTRCFQFQVGGGIGLGKDLSRAKQQRSEEGQNTVMKTTQKARMEQELWVDWSTEIESRCYEGLLTQDGTGNLPERGSSAGLWSRLAWRPIVQPYPQMAESHGLEYAHKVSRGLPILVSLQQLLKRTMADIRVNFQCWARNCCYNQ